MRCVALADALVERGDAATFFLDPESDGLQDVPAAHGHDVQVLASDRLDEFARAVRPGRFDGLVVDGYRFNEAAQRRFHEVVPVRLVIDDLAMPSRVAEMILNQNLGSRPSDYAGRIRADAQLLLGLRYALLRREFGHRAPRVIQARASRILITMGGEDQANVTGIAVRALERLSVEPLSVKILLGPRFRHADVLKRQCGGGSHRYELMANSDRVGEAMDWADLGVIACGTTVWECLACTLPLIVVPVAENQYRVAHELARRQLVRVLPARAQVTEERLSAAIEPLLSDQAARERFSRAGRQMVDGLGAIRVAEALRGHGATPA